MKGREKASKAYIKARKQGIHMSIIVDAIAEYKKHVEYRQQTDFPDLKFKNGDTWFRNHCWNDDYSIPEDSTEAERRRRKEHTQRVLKGEGV